jgi:hypothetical protein
MRQAMLELPDFTCGLHLAQAFATKKNFNMSALKSLLQAVQGRHEPEASEYLDDDLPCRTSGE